MISTRRDSVRKKSFVSSHRKSTCDRPCHEASGMGIAVEVSAASDPEEYDVDYEGVTGDVMDPPGGMDGQEAEWETGAGVWMRPEHTQITSGNLGARRSKPQLTITVPSSENLSLLQQGAGERPRSSSQKSPEPTRRKFSPIQMELRASPSLPMTPPSPRRASNWTKVKKAFLTSQYHLQHHHGKSDVLFSVSGGSSSLPPSPSKKNSFQFEGPHLLATHMDDSDSPCASLEVSPEVLLPPGPPHTSPSPQPQPSPIPHANLGQQQGVHMNIADLQKSLSGEFNRRLQEWERLKGGSGPGAPPHSPLAATVSGPTSIGPSSHPEDNLPQEFKKKLHEWEKMKEREREKIKVDMSRGQEDVKTKIHGEDDLPADFKKKLTEWKIRKALVGKSQQNVEELQKNLGEEFNRKMAEWERIKASANQGQSQVKTSASASSIQVGSTSQVKTGSGPCPGHNIKQSASAGQVLVKPQSPGPESSSPRLDRKGSGQKIKKTKSSKTEKVPLAKTDGGHKGRYKTDKELLWLEKELHKVERETQRLEREKEKFLERQARLEKMRQAMGQGPATKKEIYIKTSTGEFRFEGISQTFTKKLYEWEERRGIRPESSTIALLDPNYKAPEKEVQEKPRSPELMRLVRSKSESSVAADLVVTSGNSHPSSLSLNEMDQEDNGGLQAENKAASEPTLGGEECNTPKVAVLVQLEEVVDDGRHASAHHPATPYAPAEITRNIDSSGSEEDVTRRKRADDDEDFVSHMRQIDSNSRTSGSYRTLLQENMSLLDKLRQKENLCRALEHQMGDIDCKMDNVADQHLKTLEKLHRQVTIIMKDTGSSAKEEGEEGGDDDTASANDDPEANQRLINQLRARISELEVRGDHLKDEKEQLEMAFKLHKEQETEIAESLVMRIRELQDAGAEVNIQTVQCQTDDLPDPNEKSLTETPQEEVHDENHDDLEKRKVFKERRDLISSRPEEPVTKRDHRQREHRKTKKAPPKKVQRLHNLTGDLLFQAKRMEQALVSKHGLDRRGEQQKGLGYNNGHRQRSLRGRSSLRLTADSGSSQRRHREASARTWSSIEAITLPNESPPNGSSTWENRSAGGLDASQASGDGFEASSRSLRIHSSAHPSDQQDILAMNAELSRMAKELRMELMKMWSFRESTSPESETSESIDRLDLEEDKKHTEPDRLLAEANEVFQSIALLQKESSPPPTPQSGRSSTTRARRSPSITSFSKHRESNGFEDKVTYRNADRDRSSQSTAGTPSQRDSYGQQRQKYQDDEDDDDPHEMDNDRSKFLPPGSSLDHLLLRTQLEDDDRDWETARRRSSDGLSTVTSGPSRSHSPSPSIASSAPEAETSPRLDEEDDGISLTGTWKTATNSTLRSGEHILSSSFEWDEEEPEESRRKRENWNVAVEEERVDVPQQSKTKSLKKCGPTSDFHKSFETEVTTSSPRTPIRDLKTRRISDTQVEYETRGQSAKDECFAYTFSRTVYDDEALTAGKQGHLKDSEDARHRRFKSIPTTVAPHSVPSDKSPDIFVPTKRTIFTVQGGVLNSEQARATPTFVDNQDESLLSIQKHDTPLSTTANSDLLVEKQKSIRKDFEKDHCFSQNESQAHVRASGQSVNQSDGTTEQSPTKYLKGNKHLQQSEKVKDQSDIQHKMKEEMQNTENHSLKSNIINDGEKTCEKIDSDQLPTKNVDECSKLLENEGLDVSSSRSEEHACFSKQLKPVQLPTNTPMVTMLFQKSPPTSPPIESKRKVLEAVNEGIPTVRNIIQKFNQRITENQELLGGPFRSPPSSPPQHSPRSQRKLLSEIKTTSWKNSTVHMQGTPASVTNSSGGVLKSLSTSVIVNSEIPQQVQRSASSSLVQNRFLTNANQVMYSTKSPASPLMVSDIPELNDEWQNSQTTITPAVTPNISCVGSPSFTPGVSPTPTEVDTSYDLDVSVDDPTLGVQNQLGSSSLSIDKSPSGKLRAMKLKKAKEEFLSRGAAFPVSEHRLSGGPDSFKLRQRSGTASTDDSWRDSGEISASSPSPLPQFSHSEEIFINREDIPDLSPKTVSKRNKAEKKESFRRQSAHCILEQSALEQAKQVEKSASSGALESPERFCDQPADSESRDSRKGSIDPSTDSGKSSSRGFFKLFRRHRNRDKKDMPSVQKLCRQSLLVDFASGRGRTQSASPQPGGESHLLALQEVDGEEGSDMPRSSKTLPRGSSGEAIHPTPSRSCPSSPVAPHRSRTANWLIRGRQIFKSRSPSPNKKQR